MVKHLAIVGGDPPTLEVLRSRLEREPFILDVFERQAGLLEVLRHHQLNLVLLALSVAHAAEDLWLCRCLGSGSDRIPVIVLLPDGGDGHRVRALRMGADDCVPRSIVLEELVARVHAVMRRALPPAVDAVWLGPTLVDFRCPHGIAAPQVPRLTGREFDILKCLADHAGAVVSRDELLRSVWGYTDVPLTRTVDSCVFRLRRKLEPDPHHPVYLRKAYGDGYRLVPTALQRARTDAGDAGEHHVQDT
jgi:DNA-binding response OmpR family regulator